MFDTLPKAPVDRPVQCLADERPDLLSPDSPAGLRLVQITNDASGVHAHVYMESHIFTPDSRRLVFRRILNHGEKIPINIRQDYLLCDIADGFTIRQLTDEPGATAPAITPDGRFMYYLLDQAPAPDRGRWVLRRVCLQSFRRETVLVIDNPLPGTRCRPSFCTTLSSMSADGERLCTSGYLGDGVRPNGPFGVVVFDLARATAEAIMESPTFSNAHPQYCRCPDPESKHDILVQENHGDQVGADGRGDRTLPKTDASGADVHVIRDDGTQFRTMPWGRDGQEFCTGHQCWRGRIPSAVAGVSRVGRDVPVVEGKPGPADSSAPHRGRETPGAVRNEICREMPLPMFSHFAFDPTGTRFVSDCMRPGAGNWANAQIVVGSLPDTPDAVLKVRYLLESGTSFQNPQATHPHPFPSPDATKAFFNSDVTGQPQIWMVEGFEFPE
ncbi:MAG: hypothetical protein HN742_05570 [Lentisphaerae bacterium]|nr:hypothetical protein [Lentisphaerota bacterium]MBT5607671.1 hypothetical protein [Lentisphaerota bacterium]MBT7055172.1 hypothetical protein [Lentisphaerota bacterium]MBT7841318.1 hypothetical protein [Lentisphaerota bacterium]